MAQEDELPPPEKKGRLKWIIMIFLVLLLGGGLGVAYFMGFLDGFIGKDGDDASGGGKPSQAQVRSTPLVKLPEFLTNLSDPLGRRYVRVTVELELISPDVAREVEAQNARIRDAMIILLSSKNYSELSTMEGKHLLRNQILDRLNQILGAAKVVNVYYSDFVVQ